MAGECRMSSVECRVSGFGASRARCCLPLPSVLLALSEEQARRRRRGREEGKKRGKKLSFSLARLLLPPLLARIAFSASQSPVSLSLSLAPQSRPSPSTAIHTHGIFPRHRDRESARRRRTHAVAVAFFPISFTRKPALAFFSTDDDGDNDERPTAKRRKWTAVAAPSLASCISNAPCLVECIMRND